MKTSSGWARSVSGRGRPLAGRGAAGVITPRGNRPGPGAAGQLLGVPVCVVMPRTAPAVKRAATEGYGARIVTCEPTLAARESTVAEQVAAHGYELVHPFDDWRVIAGQGTAVLEFLEQAGPLDLVVCPVGGGGLLAGTAIAVRGTSPDTRVVGVEPERADDARRSLAAGSIQPSNDPHTIADGLRTSLGTRPFSIISRHVDEIVTASESEIVAALRFVWERMKVIIEPSSAVAIRPVRTVVFPGWPTGWNHMAATHADRTRPGIQWPERLQRLKRFRSPLLGCIHRWNRLVCERSTGNMGSPTPRVFGHSDSRGCDVSPQAVLHGFAPNRGRSVSARTLGREKRNPRRVLRRT